MIKIELNNASNGIIKKVIDTQFNGVNQLAEIITVYEIDDELEDKYERTLDFLIDISNDLGLDLGSDYSPEKIKMDVSWGDKYNPDHKQVKEYISQLTAELKYWKNYKKIIEETSLDVNDV